MRVILKISVSSYRVMSNVTDYFRLYKKSLFLENKDML
jgi:hypothetical protein